MLTVFLDANVLFSAAYLPQSNLLQLWGLDGVTLMTSVYAYDEAARNLRAREQKSRLEELMKEIRLINEIPPHVRLPASLLLPEKDLPIIAAAVFARADILITGDIEHFGRYFGKKIKGVLILRPRAFMEFLRS